MKLTTRQRAALSCLEFHKLTAKRLGVRSDVLWRLEERGLVARDAHEVWSLTGAGARALREGERNA